MRSVGIIINIVVKKALHGLWPISIFIYDIPFSIFEMANRESFYASTLSLFYISTSFLGGPPSYFQVVVVKGFL